jgi:hypothetical protein
MWRVVVSDIETSKEEAIGPLKGCEYKPTMGCDAERKKITKPVIRIVSGSPRLERNTILGAHSHTAA